MTATGASFRRRIFVVMPFGKKEGPKPRIDSIGEPMAKDEPLQVDFDDVYKMLGRSPAISRRFIDFDAVSGFIIVPAIEAAIAETFTGARPGYPGAGRDPCGIGRVQLRAARRERSLML